MKVFIGHYIKKDRNLATLLKESLSKENIDGYMAELNQEYDLLISDKVKGEINSSQYLVAVITENSFRSASIHEEIGYALGRGNIPVLLMVEETVKAQGVLIYGKEPEFFTKKNFSMHTDKIAKFIKEKGDVSRTKIITSEKFLKKRNLDDIESPDFGKGDFTELLWTRINDSLIPNGKPFVLFTACPKTLTERVDVNSNNMSEWLGNQTTIKIKNDYTTQFLSGEKTIGLDFVAYLDSPIGDAHIYKYLEIRKTGFLEQGITDPLIYDGGVERDDKRPFLHLCWITGAFWAFLKFCKDFYEKIKMEDEFDVRLSIRNPQDLMLMGFGGKLENDRKWAEPYTSNWTKKPKTNLKNISLPIDSINKKQLTDEYIETKVREFSDLISNAYGLDSSKCYNYDGTFNFEMFSYYRRGL